MKIEKNIDFFIFSKFVPKWSSGVLGAVNTFEKHFEGMYRPQNTWGSFWDEFRKNKKIDIFFQFSKFFHEQWHFWTPKYHQNFRFLPLSSALEKFSDIIRAFWRYVSSTTSVGASNALWIMSPRRIVAEKKPTGPKNFSGRFRVQKKPPLRPEPTKTFWFFAKILLQTSRMKTLRVSTCIYRSRRTNL